MKPIFLAGAVRTPIGRFGGSLQSWTAADLGTVVAKESLQRAQIRPDQVDDSIWGCARQAGGGANCARSPARLKRSCSAAPTLSWPAARKACRAFLTLPRARALACAWAILSWL